MIKIGLFKFHSRKNAYLALTLTNFIDTSGRYSYTAAYAVTGWEKVI